MAAPEIRIYTTAICPYCVRAKRLLESKGATYQEIRVDQDAAQRDLMIEQSKGRQSVPQIFIGDYHVGGFDDLAELNMDGALDGLLAGQTSSHDAT